MNEWGERRGEEEEIRGHGEVYLRELEIWEELYTGSGQFSLLNRGYFIRL